MRDILLNDDADLTTLNGDFVIGDSDEQHQEHLIVFQPGSIKRDPEAGVGIENYLMDDNIDDMLREIRHQFERDGMIVDAVLFDKELNDLQYAANYKGQ